MVKIKLLFIGCVLLNNQTRRMPGDAADLPILSGTHPQPARGLGNHFWVQLGCRCDPGYLRSFLALAYQYRNNLYHGKKGVDSLNEFCEYFDAISGLLAFLLRLYSETDICGPDTRAPLRF